jgi:hypothetical protein
MTYTSIQPSLIERLQANAMDSLIHGVEHYIHGIREYDGKYVVLHIFHAVELLFKARLAMYDETLIHKKNSQKTLGIDETIDLLIKEAHVDLTKYTEDRPNYPGQKQLGGNLKKLRDARNDIEHKYIGITDEEIKNILGEVFNFLEVFIKNELDLDLKQKLDELDEIRNDEYQHHHRPRYDESGVDSTYRNLSMAHSFYVRHMKEQQIYPDATYSKYGSGHETFICELCDEDAVVYPDDRLDLSVQEHRKIAGCLNCSAIHSIGICCGCNLIYYIGSTGFYSLKEAVEDIRPSELDIDGEDDNYYDGFCECCQDRYIDNED